MGMAPSEILVGCFSASLLKMKSRLSKFTTDAEFGDKLAGTASTVIVTVLASVIVTVAGPHLSML